MFSNHGTKGTRNKENSDQVKVLKLLYIFFRYSPSKGHTRPLELLRLVLENFKVD